MVSGINYEDFIRQNIFIPLGMNHSGFKIDVKENAPWTKGLTYDNIHATGQVPVLAQGAGGITTTAEDMDIWMTALQNGRVISTKSFREMTTDYTTDQAGINYGYGLQAEIHGGWENSGGNGAYTSVMYFNEEYGINFFIVSGQTPKLNNNQTFLASNAFLNTLFSSVNNG